MKIDDIESKKLLPNWSHDADWIQDAFDQIVLMCAGRLPAIDAPLTMQAIQCLTDEELREWYARFGVVEYYPDLNRETREKMLFWLARLYRYLGTPHAIRVLCDYVYNDLPLDVTVIDNLAFDGETLVDPTLLDLFDVDIDAGSAGISPTQAYRLVNNILRIARNSQTLRKIIYDYASDIDVNCGACSYGGDVCIDYSDNDEIARDVTPPATLPTVNTNAGFVTVYPNHNNFATGSVRAGRVWDDLSSQWVVSSYDPTKTYAAINWSAENSRSGFYGIRLSEYNGQIGLENVLANTIYRYIESQYATCDSTDATVACVYGNGFIYNAFKFTSGANDYYFVLDGVQNEWTISLNAIGYELFDPNEFEILIGFKWNDDNTELVAVNDLSNDYYWSRIVSQRDRDILSALELASSIASYTKYGFVAYVSGYTYTFIAIYSDMGETVATGHNPANCIIRYYSGGPAIMGLYYSAYSNEYVMTWKCRITRNS